ncbi:DUF1801 domain-containing protein [Ideonella sp.]|uniref:DUF1801 domain-containing protein n=1 Tax=Ideonella sp. TaxID=1929293 RepID=UPI002B4A5822|nr:DUF1801 domain-containing protein [Ideonella sp.]HJV68603.1 DUF1801 domain-containing protein [Ideonella sp.]
MRPGPRSKALISAWLDFQPPAQREVAQALRAAVREAEPALDEIIRWGQLVFVWGGAPLLAIAPHRGHVNLQIFNGYLLPPDLGPLEGHGRGTRSYRCRLQQPVDVVQVQMLVAASVARAPSEAGAGLPRDEG